MTDTTTLSSRTQRPAFRLPMPSRNVMIVGVALAVYAYFSYYILRGADAVPQFRVDLSPLLQAPFAIQIHAYGAIVTFLIGLVLLFAPKGFRLHRTLGWSWVVTMTITAMSSFFISSFSPVHFSPIHALSAWTMIGLPMGIAAVRRRDIKKHRAQMTGMFVGGMLVAGLFSFLPGRLMFSLFFAV